MASHGQAEGGPTGTAAALAAGLDELVEAGRPGASRVLLLLNDGQSADDWEKVHATAERLRRMDAQVP